MPLPTFKYYDYEPYLPSSTPTKVDVLTLIVDILGWAGARYAESKALKGLAPDIAKRMPRNGGVLVRLAYQKAQVGPLDYGGSRVFRFAAIVGAGPTAKMVLDRANFTNNLTGTIEPALWDGWEAEDEYVWMTK
jgi:hypothetical protein